MKQYYLICFATLVLSACGDSNKQSATRDIPLNKYDKISQMEWLTGRWEHKDGNMASTEVWAKQNDSTLSGFGYALSGKDTVFKEYLRIQQKGQDLYYIPTVPDQNNGTAVLFTLIHDTAGQFVFENKAHDYPQRIVYNHVEKDSIYAYVEGMQKGKMRKDIFPMKRK